MYPETPVSGRQYFNTFNFNGTEYYLNSIVKPKDSSRELKKAVMVQIIEHGITKYEEEYWCYVLWDKWGNMRKYYAGDPNKELECIIEPATLPPKVIPSKKYSDFEVPEVVKGWIIYIIAMFFSIVFRNFFIAWILISIVFFGWRKEKLQKPIEHNYGFDNIPEKIRESIKRQSK